MSNVIIRPGQTLADIAVQYLGGVERVFELAALNGLSFTSELVAGQSLLLPDSVEDPRVVRVYQERGNEPAANITIPTRDGIGVWVIGSTFIPR